MEAITATSGHYADPVRAEQTQKPKPITRRRGACHSCRARKVRCDGKVPCNQCRKFAFECQYLPSPSYKKKATPKPIETSKATLHSDQRSDQRRDGQLQNNAKDAQLQSESDFSEDIFSSAFLFGHDATTSDARELLGHIDEDEFDFNGQILFSSQCDSPVGLDWGSQASLSEVSGSASTVSPINTTILSPPCPPASAKDNLDYDRPPFLSFHAVPNVGDIHFVRRDSVAGDSLPQDVVQQGDLIKDALLDDVEDLCNRWQNPLREELSNAIQKAVLGNIDLYHPTKRMSVDSRDHTNLDRAFVSDCINACFRYPHSFATFLDKHVIETATEELTDPSSSMSPACALAYAVIASGAHILDAEIDKDQGSTANAKYYFDLAIDIERQLPDHTFSISHFQAIVVMAHFAIQVDLREASTLLSRATHYAQAMRLNRSRSLCCSVSEHSSSTNWLLIQYQYTSLCACILKEYFGRTSLRNRDADSASDLQHRLDQWLQLVPEPHQSTEVSAFHSGAITPQQRCVWLHIFLQYHEACLIIHMQRNRIGSSNPVGLHTWLSNGDRKRPSSIREILEVSSHITTSDVRLNPSIYRLVCTATCILATTTIREPTDRKDLSYLAIAAGFFGRMSLGNIEGPLEEITGVIRIAQQLILEHYGKGL